MSTPGPSHLKAHSGAAASHRKVAEDENFIPFRKRAIISLCAQRLPEEERAAFREFAEILSSLLHHRFRSRIESVKSAYHVLNPSLDMRQVINFDAADREAAQKQLERDLIELAEQANFTRIDDAELQRAFDEKGLIKVKLDVDMDDIDSVMLFSRGQLHRQRTEKQLFGLRSKEIKFLSYGKVLIYVRFKDESHFADRDVDDLPCTPGATIVKLFENVPRHDVEMLFPNVRVGMRTIDKLLIGVPAIVSGIVIIVTRLIASLGLLLLLIAFWLGVRDEEVELNQAALVTIGAGLAAVGGFAFKQFNSFKNRKIQFMKALSENLYFRNLDNDTGVFFHLLDAAEEAEVKEAVLAYHFLRASDRPLTAEELDERIESWFTDAFDSRFDFDVEDGIRKLREFDLIEESNEGQFTAVELSEGKRRMSAMWDELFQYEQVDSAELSSPRSSTIQQASPG
ncbi:DUF3754 domain-containing protein [Hoyosella rhizosphaerae]|uniref:DUF3754 domain-containing protein n=1 Tax=Hoyosella rhizosphaerae TaxID=1755582 RepID=A0A916XI43_9ACTN|nr:TMEM143 family protein [Hoyosella rhizosphaerae]MBN4925475.1 DUF3754 domain-containing protein [Hoyosella rhizosphaerae]GGC74884.1 hypothetical protein GCM10011410_30230 [Hoyosella rhizosphaerae]